MRASTSRGAPGIAVFAAEHDTLQITWASLPRARMTLDVAGRQIELDAVPASWYRRTFGLRTRPGRGGPGALTVTGLEPSTTYDVCLSAPGYPRRRVVTGATMGSPPGRLLARFATISDCHFGERTLGALHRLHDPERRPEGMEPYPVRCAAAAIHEAEAWGASMLVAKGDLTQEGELSEFETAVDVLGRATVPVAVTFGNHDVRGPVRTAEAARMLSESGVTAREGTHHVDIDGARLVMSHTPIPHRHAGRMEQADLDATIALAASTESPTLVILHHPLRRWPVETHYPPSLSWRDSRSLAGGLLAANPRCLVLAGHTHRNRRYRASGLTVVEVGSTKDYPGQWAGYSVYEGGVRQVVRRVERPDAVCWTQMTARAMGGVWRLWSPGRLEDRCWSIDWDAGDRDEGDWNAGRPDEVSRG